MLKFFSINGNMGRIDYYKSLLFRLLIATVIAVILAFMSLFFFGYPLIRLWSLFLYYLIIVPINFRRAKDIRMNWAWLFPVLFYNFLPFVVILLIYNGFSTAISKMFYNPGINFAITIYSWVIFLLLLFMPGQAHKDFVRSKDQPA